MHEKALAIQRAALPTGHPDIANSLHNLAGVFAKQGRYTEAEALYKEALTSRRASLPADHPDIAMSLDNLAAVYWMQGRYMEVLPLLLEALIIQQQHVRAAAVALSEQQRIDFALTSQQTFFTILSMAITHPVQADTGAHLLEAALQIKGAETFLIADQTIHVRSHGTAAEKEHLAAWIDLQHQFKALLNNFPATPDERETWEHSLSSLKARSQEHERLLPKLFPTFSRHTVALSLPPDAVLLEYVRFIRADIAMPWYVVLVLNGAGNVELFDLGAAAEIDLLVQAFQRVEVQPHIANEEYEEYCEVQNTDEKSSETDGVWEKMRLALPALYTRLLRPLLPALTDVAQLLIAPDGQIALVPFEMLCQKNEPPLRARFAAITYLAAGREALRFAQAPQASGPSLVLGDPAYSRQTLATTINGNKLETQEENWTELEINRVRRNGRRLPASRLEATRIATLLHVRALVYEEASAEHLFTLSTPPHILHAATHATYLDPEEQSSDLQKSVVEGKKTAEQAAWEWQLQQHENPFDRCGIALAGADEAGRVGFLTGRQLATINLEGSFVVLSCCKAAHVGEAQGRGLMGLRTALLQAGARTAVLTLWEVEDLPTAVLMDRFYQNLLEGQAVDMALRHAQKYLSELTGADLQASWGTLQAYAEIGTMLDDLPQDSPDRILIKQFEQNLRNYCEDAEFRPFASPRHWAAFVVQGALQPLFPAVELA